MPATDPAGDAATMREIANDLESCADGETAYGRDLRAIAARIESDARERARLEMQRDAALAAFHYAGLNGLDLDRETALRRGAGSLASWLKPDAENLRTITAKLVLDRLAALDAPAGSEARP